MGKHSTLGSATAARRVDQEQHVFVGVHVEVRHFLEYLSLALSQQLIICDILIVFAIEDNHKFNFIRVIVGHVFEHTIELMQTLLIAQNDIGTGRLHFQLELVLLEGRAEWHKSGAQEEADKAQHQMLNGVEAIEGEHIRFGHSPPKQCHCYSV